MDAQEYHRLSINNFVELFLPKFFFFDNWEECKRLQVMIKYEKIFMHLIQIFKKVKNELCKKSDIQYKVIDFFDIIKNER
jgi:hypothetical protein